MLSYRTIGTGTPIVFLHGVGISSWMWGAVVSQLQGHQAILVDLPGHGDSNAIPWHSLPQSAAMVTQLMDHLELDQVQLVGLSLGGYVTLEALAAYPDRFSKAVISGVHAGGMPNQGLMIALSALMAPLACRPFFAARTARALGGPNVDIAAFQREAARTRPAAFRRASINATRFELPVGLGRFSGPLTVCCGAREHPLIKDSADVISIAVPHGSTFIAEDAGHGWPIVEPELFAALL